MMPSAPQGSTDVIGTVQNPAAGAVLAPLECYAQKNAYLRDSSQALHHSGTFFWPFPTSSGISPADHRRCFQGQVSHDACIFSFLLSVVIALRRDFTLLPTL